MGLSSDERGEREERERREMKKTIEANGEKKASKKHERGEGD